jgi:hypothetical protein
MSNYGSQLPGITRARRPKRMALADTQVGSFQKGDPITIKAGTTATGYTGSDGQRTTILPPGTVLIKESGGTDFVNADDYANADPGSLAVVDSAEAPDADWVSGTFKIFRNGVLIYTQAAGAADDTLAEFLTLLNTTNPMPNLVASDSGGGLLRITDQIGAGDAIRVEYTLATAYGTAGGSGSFAEDEGTVPDVRVLAEEVDMLDSAGAARTGSTAVSGDNYLFGHFRTADLYTDGTRGTIPASAKAILAERGSYFS